ncbi:Uncharacterized protein FWK35_00015548 [Aphis craccivora]|uniref:Uncharacterized protein n=1 Tax=Aphis craccivora TaxID=307492 RepID=A0A6G0Z3F2_APHCR|nr:Uncharacterized protein FWK35_00015548 [Aphis craccivora]
MLDEKSSLTKVIGKTKGVFRNTYGSTNDQKQVNVIDTKQKYRKLKFLKKLWRWRSSSVKKTNEELLEEGPNIEQNKVTVVTYALCFIMMLAGLSVKMD